MCGCENLDDDDSTFLETKFLPGLFCCSSFRLVMDSSGCEVFCATKDNEIHENLCLEP